MEEITPLLINIAIWSLLGGVIIFAASMVYLGAVALFNGYSNSDNWRRIAQDLEKECACLHSQVEKLTKELNKPKVVKT